MARMERLTREIRTDLLELEHAFAALSSTWRDEAGRAFEREHWCAAVDVIEQYLRALEALDDAIYMAERAAAAQ